VETLVEIGRSLMVFVGCDLDDDSIGEDYMKVPRL
jgi:hypothetical protein